MCGPGLHRTEEALELVAIQFQQQPDEVPILPKYCCENLD